MKFLIVVIVVFGAALGVAEALHMDLSRLTQHSASTYIIGGVVIFALAMVALQVFIHNRTIGDGGVKGKKYDAMRARVDAAYESSKDMSNDFVLGTALEEHYTAPTSDTPAPPLAQFTNPITPAGGVQFPNPMTPRQFPNPSTPVVGVPGTSLLAPIVEDEETPIGLIANAQFVAPQDPDPIETNEHFTLPELSKTAPDIVTPQPVTDGFEALDQGLFALSDANDDEIELELDDLFDSIGLDSDPDDTSEI